MIQFITRYFISEDPRGRIEGIINKGEWREINYIFSSANISRGNHYHKKIYELFIILDGEIDVMVQKVEDSDLVGERIYHTVFKGDVFIVNPNIFHVFFVKKESKWLNALSEPINPENPDIHRISSIFSRELD